MEIHVGIILYSELGNKNPDAGHIKCSRRLHLAHRPLFPHPCIKQRKWVWIRLAWRNSNKRVSLSFKLQGSHSLGLYVIAAMPMVFGSILTLLTFFFSGLHVTWYVKVRRVRFKVYLLRLVHFYFPKQMVSVSFAVALCAPE